MSDIASERRVYMVRSWDEHGRVHREWPADTRRDAYRIMDDWMRDDPEAVRVAVDEWIGERRVRRVASTM